MKWCSAKTREREDSVFSPPDRLAMFFQLFLGGRTLNRMPSAGVRIGGSQCGAAG